MERHTAVAPEALTELEKNLEMLIQLQEKHLNGCAAVIKALVQHRIWATEAVIKKVTGNNQPQNTSTGR